MCDYVVLEMSTTVIACSLFRNVRDSRYVYEYNVQDMYVTYRQAPHIRCSEMYMLITACTMTLSQKLVGKLAF